jgi:pyruvate dehydrogenase E2 component (dihydrolipoamide acetyltransferase)
MLKFGQTMEEGKVLRWLKNEGESLNAGESVVEVETDKVNVEIPAEQPGILRKILVQPGATVPILTPLAWIGTLDEPVPEAEEHAVGAAVSAREVARETLNTYPRGAKAASPRARKLAAERNIDLDNIAGTGEGGRITEDDVRAYIERTLVKGRPPSGLSRVQIAVGKLLQHSMQTAPHFYLSAYVSVDQLLVLKAEFKDHLPMTITDLIVKAVGLAVRDCPEVNCHWEDDQLVQNEFVNVGIAVELDGGLVIATIPSVAERPLSEISADVRRLIQQAREGTVKGIPRSITVSNLGMHGIRQFTAIINPPEIAILAVGEVSPRTLVLGEGRDATRISNEMILTLSCDHRALNGAQGARFLNAVRQYLEDPRPWFS